MHTVRQLAEGGRQLQHVAPNGSLHTSIIGQQALVLRDVIVGQASDVLHAWLSGSGGDAYQQSVNSLAAVALCTYAILQFTDNTCIDYIAMVIQLQPGKSEH